MVENREMTGAETPPRRGVSVSRTQRWELTLLAGIATLVAAFAVLAGRFDLVSAKRSDLLYDKTYSRAQPWGPLDRLEGTWETTPRGLTVSRGSVGILTIVVPNDPQAQLIALLFGRAGEDADISVSVSRDGRQFRMVSPRPGLDGTRVDLSRESGNGERVWVRIEASAVSSIAELSRVRLVRLKHPVTFPNLPIAALLIVTPVLAYLARQSVRRPYPLAYGFLVLCGLTVLTELMGSPRVTASHEQWWELVVMSQARDGYYLAPYFVLLLLIGLQARVWQAGENSDAKRWGQFAIAGILAWGGSSRLAAFSEVGGSQLGPDAITYMHLAESLQSPYDTMYREPLWIWMIKAWFTVVGVSSAHQRLLTILLSLAVIWTTYKLFADYTQRPLVGVLAAASVAGNDYLIRLSAQGLREECYLLAVLSIVYLVFVQDCHLSPLRQAVWLGAAGAAAHLLRFNSYLFFFPLLAIWAWRQGRNRWSLALLPVLLISVLSVPHLVHNAQVFGDPLYSVNVHFVWSRNYEFVLLKQTGCPGCPSREEVEAESTSGPIVNAWRYLFGLHTTREVLTRTAQGYGDLYLRPGELFEMQSGTASRWGFGFYLIGLVLVLVGPYRAMVAVILLLANGVPFALTLGIDPRIAIQTAPFVAFILAYGLARSIEWVVERFERTSTQASSPDPLSAMGGQDKVSGVLGGTNFWGRS